MTGKIEILKQQLQHIRENQSVSQYVYNLGNSAYINGQCLTLTQSASEFEFMVNDKHDDFITKIYIDERVVGRCSCKSVEWCHHQLASMLQLCEDLGKYEDDKKIDGKQYTREGMINRVLNERLDKANAADYRLDLGDNVYGEHILTNEKHVKYKLTLHDFESEKGYCSCPDYKTNKLGTCKHLMYAFINIKKSAFYQKNAAQQFPFIDIFLDPTNNYQICWYYPHEIDNQEINDLLNAYFGNSHLLPEQDIMKFVGFLTNSEKHKEILVRPEIFDKIQTVYNKQILDDLKKKTTLDFSVLKLDLFQYQKEGIEFATFKEGAIIADEMGLGKTAQAIGTAIMKKNIFDFKRTLIICPASLKDQWKKEIKKCTDLPATVVEGLPEERENIYRECTDYFLIINYETVLRDFHSINKFSSDFIILDEAQRIKNYSTITANSIKSLQKKHALVITGTPIENRLIDLYSIVGFVDNTFLAPLWEFSYQHCYFDTEKKNKINGYYNLQNLKQRIQKILIRREKCNVMQQLPNITQVDIPLKLHPDQASHHAGLAQNVSMILQKKFITPIDMQRITLLLNNMRMVCDSTYLVDHETNISPKLEELEHVLLEKLDIKANQRKIIIFSEWKRMNFIIAKMLRKNNIGYVELNGSIPVKKRPDIIKEFENNPACRIFLSTEAGGTGLNLQVADTVINFELPWNPAKKNQRIGRIDRLGQKETNLTILNFIMKDSIEMRIASGLMLKENLFESVLNKNIDIEYIDFSEKGRSQFLEQLKEMAGEFEKAQRGPEYDVEEVKQAVTENELDPEAEEKPREEAQGKLPLEYEDEPSTSQPAGPQQMEDIMKQGLGFLSGIYKMATGQDMGADGMDVKVDEKTGEVTMKFKLPGR